MINVVRKLNTRDLASFCVCIKKTGSRGVVMGLLRKVAEEYEKHKAYLGELKAKAEAGDAGAAEALRQEADGYNWLSGVGIDGMLILAEAFADKPVQDEVYRFLGSVMDVSAAEIEDMELEALGGAIRELFEINNMLRFFNAAQKMGI